MTFDNQSEAKQFKKILLISVINHFLHDILETILHLIYLSFALFLRRTRDVFFV